MTINLETIQSCVPSSMTVASVNGGKGFDVRFAKGQLAGSSAAEKVLVLADTIKKLQEKGIPLDHIQAQFVFKSPTTGEMINYPRLYVNTELTQRQQEQKAISSTVEGMAEMQRKLDAALAMIATLAPGAVKTETQPAADGPF